MIQGEASFPVDRGYPVTYTPEYRGTLIGTCTVSTESTSEQENDSIISTLGFQVLHRLLKNKKLNSSPIAMFFHKRDWHELRAFMNYK